LDAQTAPQRHAHHRRGMGKGVGVGGAAQRMTMQRRHFLKASLSSLVIACSARTELEGPDASPVTPVSQRTGPIEVDEALFPQSVASGDPKPESVVLWTRSPDVGGLVFAQVALDAKFERLVALESDDDFVAEVPLTVSPQHDYCAKLRVTNLRPE